MKVLVLCPHTDDEINCAGTIDRHIKNGDSVRVLAFSVGNSETGANRSEFELSMSKLGITDYHLFDFDTRYFYGRRQEILQILCDENVPDIVYCPTLWDCHQDHEVITSEAIRAFRGSSIYGYEVLHNAVTEQTVNHYVVLDKGHIYLKASLAKCYPSQAFRPYMSFDYFEAVARLRGYQIAVQYAEAFQTIRSIKK